MSWVALIIGRRGADALHRPLCHRPGPRSDLADWTGPLARCPWKNRAARRAS